MSRADPEVSGVFGTSCGMKSPAMNSSAAQIGPFGVTKLVPLQNSRKKTADRPGYARGFPLR